jgi:hypothetical protein
MCKLQAYLVHKLVASKSIECLQQTWHNGWWLLLSQVGAQTWLSWVQEGLLLDDRTRGLTARLVTYNAELKVFADIQVAFDFQAGGSIQVRLHTLPKVQQVLLRCGR